MSKNNELEYLFNTFTRPQHILYEELARDYLLYFGNENPSANQIIVFKKLLIDVFFRNLLNFSEKLTLKEMKCLYLAFRGISINNAAKILDTHPDTIKYYRKKAIKKLGCKNMVEAAFKSSETNFQHQLCEKLITKCIKTYKVFIKNKE